MTPFLPIILVFYSPRGYLVVGRDVFGHILVFMKKVSLITKRKAEMLDGLISFRIKCL